MEYLKMMKNTTLIEIKEYLVYSVIKHVRNWFHTLEFKFSMEYLKMMKNRNLIEI
jgi:hypothetical protein